MDFVDISIKNRRDTILFIVFLYRLHFENGIEIKNFKILFELDIKVKKTFVFIQEDKLNLIVN